MKVIVAYFSYSGRTKQVAEAIFQEIQAKKEIKELKDITTLEGYDFVFVGFPVHGFDAPEEAKTFLDRHCRGRKIALFVTHGAPEHSTELQPWLKKCREAASTADVIDMFNCQGELAQDVADALLASDNPHYRMWGEHRHTTLGQPDESRLELARAFARETLEKVKTQL